jgi:hypothetical protein
MHGNRVCMPVQRSTQPISTSLFAALTSLVVAAVGCQGPDSLSEDRALTKGAEESPAGEPPAGEPPVIVSGCAGGVEACAGDGNCESCIDDGACAEGPDPVWIVGSPSIAEGCVCAQASEPETCQFEFCCAVGSEWSAEACDCVEEGGGEPPDIVSGCAGGVEACAGDANCEACIDDGACAEGPDPIWIVGSSSIAEGCVCAQPSEPETCQFEFCCAVGFVWSAEACDCTPCDPPSGTH